MQQLHEYDGKHGSQRVAVPPGDGLLLAPECLSKEMHLQRE